MHEELYSYARVQGLTKAKGSANESNLHWYTDKLGLVHNSTFLEMRGYGILELAKFIHSLVYSLNVISRVPTRD